MKPVGATGSNTTKATAKERAVAAATAATLPLGALLAAVAAPVDSQGAAPATPKNDKNTVSPDARDGKTPLDGFKVSAEPFGPAPTRSPRPVLDPAGISLPDSHTRVVSPAKPSGQSAAAPARALQAAPAAKRLPIIGYGADGSAVKTLQRDLKARKLYAGKIDGRFGPQTLESVKRFQRKQDLKVDGIVGPRTWKALQSAVDEPTRKKPAKQKTVKKKTGPKPPSALLRNINTRALYPSFRRDIEGMVGRLHANGYTYYAISGERTWKQQERLYRQGRPGGPKGPRVTNARAGQSDHNYAIAADFVRDRNPKKAGLQPSWNRSDYLPLAREARRIGLDAGYY